MAAAAVGMIQQQLTALGEQLKTGLREVRLTVGWKDGKATESFTLVTHLVVLTSGEQRRLAGQPPVSPLAPLPVKPPGTP
jgi:hypothetical protein